MGSVFSAEPVGRSEAWVRVFPFVVFVVLTAGQGRLGEGSAYGLYALKTAVGAGMIFWMWPRIPEMRPVFTWRAVGAGLLVLGFWVGLEGWYPPLDGWSRSSTAAMTREWNPVRQYGEGSATAWFFMGTRLAGSALVVPLLEETFYRSFLYRWIQRPDFHRVPLSGFHAGAFFLTAVMFGLSHREWLPGILCGVVYQGLVLGKGRLGEAITAHAVTNLGLGLWVVLRGEWQYW